MAEPVETTSAATSAEASRRERRSLLTVLGSSNMKIVIRLVGVLAALSVFQTVWFLAYFDVAGVRTLLATGIFGIITVVGWLLTVIIGPIAAVQLFRLRDSGRIAGATLFGYMLLYYVAGVVAFRGPNARIASILGLSAGLIAVIAILLSPAARRVCEVASDGRRTWRPN